MHKIYNMLQHFFYKINSIVVNFAPLFFKNKDFVLI